jgi:TonB-linked SusC/RagA family outer membrane protein
MRKTLLTLMVISMFALSAWAQTRQVSGRVTDDKTGETLIGVGIIVKGTNRGTTTDANGHFALSVPSGTVVLNVSYIGYITQTVTVTNQTTLNIKMQNETKGLNEVVVIGYGAVKKKDLTGSVVSIKGDEVTKTPSSNPIEALQGKIPGADITRSSGQAGAGVNISLRGNRSIVGSNNPLYIVDGVIYYGNIMDIDANDIQSVDVLKDASSTAIYGSRGANGVIIFTTKRGAAGQTKVSVNSYAGVTQASLYPKVNSGPEYVALKREAYRAAGKWSSVADDPKIFNSTESYDIQNNIWTDYQKLLLHKGLQQDHQVGITGGSEKTKVYFSLNYYDEKGLLKLDNLQRYSGRLSIDQTVSKMLKVGMQSQMTYYDQSVRQDPLNQANKIIPLGSAYDASGNIVLYPNSGAFVNPLADEQTGAYSNLVKNNRTFAAAYLEFTPIKGLMFRNSRTGIYMSSSTIARNGSFPRSNYNTSNGTDLLWDNILTYQKTLNKHSFTLTGITSYQDRKSDNGAEQGDNQLLASQLFYGLGGATTGLIASTGYSKQDIVSFAGRVNYSFNERYLLTLTGRSDGSSKLAEGHKWTFFPSAAVAWRVIDESFMKNIKTISDLKLRVSYGIAGNDPYNPYVTQSVLTQVPFSYGEILAQGYTYNPTVGNPDLKWERSATTNIGLDFGLFNNRLTGTIDVYDTKTHDLLLPRILPTSTGVSSTVQNIGQTENKGIEIGLNSTNIHTSSWNWTTGITFTRNVEKITQLITKGVDDIASGYFVGYPTSVYYDYQKIGIWQTQDAALASTYGQSPGTIRLKDQNGDGKIDATNDRVVLGSPRPKWSGGLDNTVRFKNFDVNVYVFARVGQMINANYLTRYNAQSIENSTQGLDYWTPENPTNAYPRPNANGGLLYTSTLGYTNGSFVRVRDITLGYTIPKKLLGKTFISGVRVYATGKNLFTFSHLKNYDPERGGSENFPMTKLVSAGIKADF